MELLGNLLPQFLETRTDGLILTQVSKQPVGTIPACCVIFTGIVMNIDDAVTASSQYHVNDLLHTSHPSGINIIIIVHVREPCHRYTDHIEALLSDGIDNLRRGLRLSPAGLPINRSCRIEPALYFGICDIVVRLQGVT